MTAAKARQAELKIQAAKLREAEESLKLADLLDPPENLRPENTTSRPPPNIEDSSTWLTFTLPESSQYESPTLCRACALPAPGGSCEEIRCQLCVTLAAPLRLRGTERADRNRRFRDDSSNDSCDLTDMPLYEAHCRWEREWDHRIDDDQRRLEEIDTYNTPDPLSAAAEDDEASEAYQEGLAEVEEESEDEHFKAWQTRTGEWWRDYAQSIRAAQAAAASRPVAAASHPPIVNLTGDDPPSTIDVLRAAARTGLAAPGPDGLPLAAWMAPVPVGAAWGEGLEVIARAGILPPPNIRAAVCGTTPKYDRSATSRGVVVLPVQWSGDAATRAAKKRENTVNISDDEGEEGQTTASPLAEAVPRRSFEPSDGHATGRAASRPRRT